MATETVPRHRIGAEGLPWLIARVLGALSLLAVGIVHLQQYFELYSEIPTIGTLFVLNFVGATVVCVGLLAPLARLGRWGGAALTLLALAGIAQAATAFVFLFQRTRRRAQGKTVRGFVVALSCGVLTAAIVTLLFEQLFYVRLP